MFILTYVCSIYLFIDCSSHLCYCLISFFIINGLTSLLLFFFFNDTATTEIYTLSLHDALPMTLRGLRDYVIPTYQTRVFAFLHISATGLTINRIMPELADIKFAQVEEAARTAAENRGLVLGIKVRIAHGATGQGNQANAREALRRGRQAADLAGVRLMVHVSDTPIPLDEILEHLRESDIATHIFNGNAEQVLGPDGRIRAAVRA